MYINSEMSTIRPRRKANRRSWGQAQMHSVSSVCTYESAKVFAEIRWRRVAGKMAAAQSAQAAGRIIECVVQGWLKHSQLANHCRTCPASSARTRISLS